MSTHSGTVSSPFSATGGARVGWLNATWPLANLSATPERLTISVLFSGKYEFAPQDVVVIERYTIIPVMGWGVRIVHRRMDFPERFIFWHPGSPETILRGIREAGFVGSAAPADVPQRRGIPIRWSVIIAVVVLWNGLFLLDFGRSGFLYPQPGVFVLLALALVFSLSLATLRWPKAQALVMKPGRHFAEIRGVVGLLACISGFMLVVFSILVASGGFKIPQAAKGPGHRDQKMTRPAD